MTPPPAAAPMAPPPDGGWGWVVVFASFMIHIVTDGVTYSFGVIFVELVDYFKTSQGATAFILSLLAGITLCSGPISSLFVNRYGCRAVTVAGAVLGSVCLLVSRWAPNIYMLYVTIGIGTGFGFGLIYLPAIVSVTCYFEKYRSLATGIAVCGSGLGTFVFSPVIEILISNLQWQNTLTIVSAFVLACALFGILFRPLPEPPAPEVYVTAPPEAIPLETKNNNSNFYNFHNSASNLQRPRSIGEQLNKIKKSDTARMALSQPMLADTPKTNLHYGSQNFRKHSGIMYRKDILYSGSLHNIPLNNRSQSLKSEEETPLREQGKIMNGYSSETKHDIELEEKPTCCGISMSQETVEMWKQMLNMSLLRDPVFIIFTVSNFLTSIGYYIPYVYLVAAANFRGITPDISSYLLSVVGIANTLGRIILGYIADKPWVNRLWVYNLCLTICGVATALSALCFDFVSFAVYASVFGFTIGAYVGLTSVILVDLLGLDKLTNAFGLLLLFQGIASLLGPPIAGWLYDGLHSYDPGFYVAGVTIAISGLMLFAIPPVQRHQAARNAA